MSEVIKIDMGITDEDLCDLLNKIAAKDLAEGYDINQHPAYIAASRIIELNQSVKDLRKYIEDQLAGNAKQDF